MTRWIHLIAPLGMTAVGLGVLTLPSGSRRPSGLLRFANAIVAASLGFSALVDIGYASSQLGLPGVDPVAMWGLMNLSVTGVILAQTAWATFTALRSDMPKRPLVAMSFAGLLIVAIIALGLWVDVGEAMALLTLLPVSWLLVGLSLVAPPGRDRQPA